MITNKESLNFGRDLKKKWIEKQIIRKIIYFFFFSITH